MGRRAQPTVCRQRLRPSRNGHGSRSDSALATRHGRAGSQDKSYTAGPERPTSRLRRAPTVNPSPRPRSQSLQGSQDDPARDRSERQPLELASGPRPKPGSVPSLPAVRAAAAPGPSSANTASAPRPRRKPSPFTAANGQLSRSHGVPACTRNRSPPTATTTRLRDKAQAERVEHANLERPGAQAHPKAAGWNRLDAAALWRQR